jgi:hypothetical protein
MRNPIGVRTIERAAHRPRSWFPSGNEDNEKDRCR